MIKQVIDQAQLRVFQGERVPVRDQLFSIFETQSDMIIKGSRDIQYGRKLNLSSVRCGLILDRVIEAGNPADTDRLLPMLDPHIEYYAEAPRHLAVDVGYASKDNLDAAKALGVNDVALQKNVG